MISVVSPVHNEKDNILTLYGEIMDVIGKLNVDYEVIFVDDGSVDGSFEVMKKIALEDKNFKGLKLRKNFGQSSALQAGFDWAQGDVIVSIDSDLQNNPKDIPRLVKRLNEGYDCVSGWRIKRRDSWGKRLFSHVSRLLRCRFLGSNLHDFGCTLKAYRKQALKELNLSGEMHRYIPSLLRWRGFTVTEIPVDHRQRKHGKSSYGTTRLFKGFMDLINVWFWQKFHDRPLYLFGGLGILSVAGGVVTGLVSLYWKIFEGISFTATPLPLVFAFMVLAGALLFVSGLMSDVLLKNYYALQQRKVYSIKETIN